MFKRKQSATQGESSEKKQKTSTTYNPYSSSTELWRKVFMDAQDAFKQSKFDEAAALFTRALTLEPDHATILDCRSACYEKLGDYPSALADAKKTIHAAPADARGYLRAGKLLSLQKKYKAAIKIYATALERVKPDDKRYSVIITMKTSAERALSPPKSLDFMTILPYDVKAMIFSYLSFDRRVQCMAVSKRWRQFALDWNGMWRDLDFGNRGVNQHTIKRYMSYAKGRHIRRLALSDMEQSMMEKVLNLIISEDCQYIETLEFKHCVLPHTLFLRVLRLMGKHLVYLNLDGSLGISFYDIFKDVLKTCTKLKRVSIKGIAPIMDNKLYLATEFMKLEPYQTQVEDFRVELQTNASMLVAMGEKLFCYFPKLRLFEFADVTVDFDELHHLLATHCPQLVSLSMGFRHHTTRTPLSENASGVQVRHFSMSSLALTPARYSVPFISSKAVETMIFTNVTGVGPVLSRVASLPDGLGQLRTLHLTSVFDIDEDDLMSIINACSNLEDLKLTHCQGLTDTVLASFHHVNKLKRLDISQSMAITGAGIKKLIDSQKGSLEKLIMNDCNHIQSDAVQWAKEQLGRNVVECRRTVRRR
ncbi:hypothetical protein RMATCC62417_15636 [Rhizopus microsporus]|nr:hypothetical protein RMATCC62417_15636 [Rhizopus microsporus]